jgi:hypothetical protein
LLESVPRRRMSGPPCALQASLTTVSCGATVTGVGRPPGITVARQTYMFIMLAFIKNLLLVS